MLGKNEQEIINLKSQISQLHATISDKNQALEILEKDLQKYKLLVNNNKSDLIEQINKLEYVNNNYKTIMEDAQEELKTAQVSSQNSGKLQEQNEKIAKLEEANTNYIRVIKNSNLILKEKNEQITKLELAKNNSTHINDDNANMLADNQQLLRTQIAKCNDLTLDYEKLSREYKMALQQAEEGNQYKASFNTAVKVYEAYHQISKLLSYAIGLKDTEQNGVKIYLYFVQKAHIDRLWEYVRLGLVKNKKDEHFLSLQQFLYMVMEQFFIVNPRYQFTDDKEGTEFNILEHELHESSKEKVGSLRNIILKGYLNKKTKNIMKQSLVTLK